VSAAGEKDTASSSKNTGQSAPRPDAGGNQGEQKGDLSGVKAGESHSNDDHTKAAAANNAKAADDAKNANNAKAADDAKKANDAKAADDAKNADDARAADDAKNADDAKAADDAKTANDVDSPGCAFGNNQKNGQLATAPGCNKNADTEVDHSKAVDTSKDDAKIDVDDATTPAAGQPVTTTTVPADQPVTSW
jgi:hypothetical protein